MSITTDRDGLAIVNTKNSHTCNSDASAQKAEAHQLRVRVRKQSGDISRRPASIIRTELQGMDENSLQPKDIYNASLSLYRERRKKFLLYQKPDWKQWMLWNNMILLTVKRRF